MRKINMYLRTHHFDEVQKLIEERKVENFSHGVRYLMDRGLEKEKQEQILKDLESRG